MGAPLFAYVQNIVQDVRVRVFSLLVMCGSTASARGPATAGLLARGLLLWWPASPRPSSGREGPHVLDRKCRFG